MKLFIKNRKEQKVSVLIDETDNSKELVFIMHGLSGNKEQPHIKLIADIFKENNYTVVSFDTTNTIGESEGSLEDATITNYYEDLEDVIKWSKDQSWYKKPFVLVGHSMGGICVGLYAENFPSEVKALAPLSTLISGKLSLEAHPKEELEEWEKTGWRTWESSTTPGLIKKVKWLHMEDRLKYDLLEKIDVLKMPILLVVGDKDQPTPVKHQKILFENLKTEKKEIHIIKNCPHTFRDKEHLDELREIVSEWVKNLDG